MFDHSTFTLIASCGGELLPEMTLARRPLLFLPDRTDFPDLTDLAELLTSLIFFFPEPFLATCVPSCFLMIDLSIESKLAKIS